MSCEWDAHSACYLNDGHSGKHQTWHTDKIDTLEADLAAAEAKALTAIGALHDNARKLAAAEAKLKLQEKAHELAYRAGGVLSRIGFGRLSPEIEVGLRDYYEAVDAAKGEGC